MNRVASKILGHIHGAKLMLPLVIWLISIRADTFAQSYWQKTNDSGPKFIRSLVTNASGHIFAGTNDSGIYRSMDNGNNWKRVVNGLNHNKVVSLAVLPNGYIFAGTEGGGVYRSIDNGDHWRQNASDIIHPYVPSLAADVNGNIFAGTDGGGVFRSVNNGDDWKEVNNGLTDFFLFALGVLKEKRYLLAGTFEDGVFRSKNNGDTWKQEIAGMTQLQIYSFADNVKGHVFAGTLGGVYRSMDSGDSWTLFQNGLTNSRIRSLALNKGGHIFAGTLQGVFRSIDNGNTWIRFNAGLSDSVVYSLSTEPTGRLLAGTDSRGVFRAVDVEIPNIRYSQPSSKLASEEIRIEANITDDYGIETATLHYRQGGEAKSVPSPMTQAERTYTGYIPAAFVTSRGVEYYIEATDSFDNVAQLPTFGIFSVQVRIGGQGEMKHDAQGKPAPLRNGSEQNAYRLFSVPLDVEDKSPKAILEDDLGMYDKKKWRFYALRDDYYNVPTGTSIYTEFPNTEEMKPGKAFWLIVKEPSKVIDTGPAVSNKADQEYAIALHPGWNFIGNPFNFPIPVEKLRLKNHGSPPTLRYFSGEWNKQTSNPILEILPFEGYAIFDSTFPGNTLLVNPNLSASSSQFFKQTTSQREDISLSIQILAQCQEARDVDNVATVAATASRNHDTLDQPEPPVIGEYVSVYFPHREWNMLAKTYCLDARPEPTDGEVWEFEVKTNIRDKVNLTFEGIGEVPKEFEVWLVDDALQITLNLRESNSYAVAGSEQPKQLKLVVGSRDFVNEKITEAQAIPARYELSQNFPNPFNPATTIRYGLPKAERVTLKIYNLLGEEVATLVHDEQKAAGYHAAIWDGRNKNGKMAASGVYVYRMQAGSFTITKKLALVK